MGTPKGALVLALVCVLTQACAGEPTAPYYAPRDEDPDVQDAGTDAGGDDDLDRVEVVGTTDPQIDKLVEIGADLEDPSRLCSGWDHSCAIDRDGQAWCWGNAAYGLDPPSGLPKLVKIACGYSHTCALGDDQNVYCWGEGTSADAASFSGTSQGQSAVPEGMYKDVAIGGNSLTTCAIALDDQVLCWGAGDARASVGFHLNFGQGRPPAGAFRGLVMGDAHGCAIEVTTGEAACWGGTGADGCFPKTSYNCGQASAPPGGFVRLAAGSYHTCGLREDGAVTCWGTGLENQNCDPDSGGVAFDCGQAKVPDDIEADIVGLSAGTLHTCAVTADYKARCWGWNAYQQSTVPMHDFSQLAPGDLHSCGIRTDGTLECWGFNQFLVTEPPNDFPGVY